MTTDARRWIHVFALALMMLTLLSPFGDQVAAQQDDSSPDPTVVATDTATNDQASDETPVTTDDGANDAAPTEEVTEPADEPTQASVPTDVPTQAVDETTPEPTKPVDDNRETTPEATSTKAPAEPTKPQPVSSPTFKLSKSKSAVGTSVSLAIADYAPNTNLTVTWDGGKLGAVTSDADGAATFSFDIPISVAGAHKVRVASSDASRGASFTVTARLVLGASSAKPGDTVAIDLTGFAAREQISMLWGSTAVASMTTSASGSWKGTLKVPSSAKSGDATVTASGDQGHAPTAGITVKSVAKTVSEAGTATTGALVIKLMSSTGKALAGGCFTLFKSVNSVRGAKVTSRCDAADNNSDGTTTITNLAAGAYIIAASTVPAGYLPGADTKATVTAGATKTVTINFERNTGLTVLKTDENATPLKSSCFTVYTALANGNLGNLKASACDDDDDANDGVIRFGDLSTDDYVLVEKVVPQGYARASRRHFSFTSGKNQTLSVQDSPGGSVAVTVLNEAKDPIKGSCFDAYIDLGGGALGNFVDRGCNDDGNVVVIQGLAVGKYYLVQSHAPVGYSNAANVKFTIEAHKDVSISVTDLPTTKLVVRKKNEQDEKLPGACFSVYKATSSGRGKLVYDRQCDSSDHSSDGYLTLPLSPGSYVLAETTAPKGYLIAADIKFSVTSGRDTAVDVVDQLGGIAEITDVDQFEPDIYVPTGACFTVWNSKSGTRIKLGTACDSGDGRKDGITHVIGLPTGTWFLEQTTIPWGYFSNLGFNIGITAGATTEVNFYNEHWPLLIIHKVDENGDPLGDACFTAFVDMGGGQRGPEWSSPDGKLCDKDEDGDLFAWVTPGNQILVETKSPLDYLPIKDTPFVMVRGQITELTVQDFKVASIAITKTDLDDKLLTGACFDAYHNVNGKRGALAGTGCDKENGADSFNKSLDAITIINGLAPGNYLIAEKTPPKGYFPAADTPVTVAEAENEATIADEPWPSLTITKVDDTGAAVNGACFRLYTVKNGVRGIPYGLQACSNLSNKIVIGAESGTYILAEAKTPTGFLTAADVTVTYKRGSNKKLTVIDPPSALIQVKNINEEKQPLGGACWALWTDLSGTPGKQVVQKCAPTGATSNGIVLMETKAGKYWLRQYKTPDGYKPLADRKVTLVARETLNLTIANLPYPRLVINSVDAGNHPLLDACFELYVDGGTTLGTKVASNWCDKTDGASDGTTTKRIKPGRYVAREITAPDGYVKAGDFKFTIAEDKDLVLKLTHQIAGVVVVNTTDRASLELNGACYELWTKLDNGKKGVLVAKACDKDPADVKTKLDGFTRLFALPPGAYILSESFAPSAYLKASDRTVTVIGGQEVDLTVVNDHS